MDVPRIKNYIIISVLFPLALSIFSLILSFLNKNERLKYSFEELWQIVLITAIFGLINFYKVREK